VEAAKLFKQRAEVEELQQQKRNCIEIIDDDAKEIAELKAEVERLDQWKDNLISNLMALEIYEHKHYDDPFIALAAYGQWNWNAGELASKSDATMLQSQLNRAVELVKDALFLARICGNVDKFSDIIKLWAKLDEILTNKGEIK
jgi:hypothetical protein